MCIWCGRSGNDVFTDSVNKIVWKNLMNLNFICPNARNAHNESDDEQEKNIEQLKQENKDDVEMAEDVQMEEQQEGNGRIKSSLVEEAKLQDQNMEKTKAQVGC